MVTTRSAGPRSGVRRSARLSGTGSLGQDEFLRLLQEKSQKPSKKRKRRNDDEDEPRSHPKREGSPSPESSSDARLKCREQTLKQRETDLKKKESDLDSQAQNLNTIMKGKEKEMTLEFLEEHLSCALCCEIIACPYSPISGNCGHSFCAMCLLKWYFSRLHDDCGSWHERVACPFCRAPLTFTPAIPPRDINTFPFAPNRLADACIQAAVEKLASNGSPKPEADGRSQSRRASRVKKEESVGLLLESDVIGWSEYGRNRTDWNNRNRRGHDEMEDIRSRWTVLAPEDFHAIKSRLNV
ncbi:hypothetical protein SCHPADRAFT_999187 [Schizopora paradoxa]|uniref:RING-type domain-containing protein n=1 Tax=Schizopora paradoxa TaxID=27342 RepID=A0A0H2RNM1_9AGAM|nr:hypothetical protein SCHPADRAFT_999187 [Schizopora paradoxa]